MSDKFMEDLANALDVTATEFKPPTQTPQDEKALRKETEVESDYSYTQEKLKQLVETGMSAVEDATSVASSTGEAKHIEALSSLLKTVGELAKGVLESSKTKSEVEKNRGVAGPQKSEGFVQNNNTVFIGNSAELLKQLKDEQAKLTIDGNATEIKNVER